jgi:hypothetical protein
MIDLDPRAMQAHPCRVGAGLALSDRVINNPPDAIREGDVVRIQGPDTN